MTTLLLINQSLKDEEDVLDSIEAAEGLSDDDENPDYQPDSDDYDQQSDYTLRRSPATRSTTISDSARPYPSSITTSVGVKKKSCFLSLFVY